MRRLAPLLLLSALFASPLRAAAPEATPPWMPGYEAAKKKDWATAAKIWQPLAEAGNPQAQFFLAELYRDGLGVEKNKETALAWLKKAAEAGLPIAQFNYGNWFYLRGNDEAGYREAARWWRLAAERDFYPAQYNMAILYHLGQGVPKDMAQARLWYERAAKNGSEPANKALAKLAAGDETPPKVKKTAGEMPVAAARPAGNPSTSVTASGTTATAKPAADAPEVAAAKAPAPTQKVIYGASRPAAPSTEPPKPVAVATLPPKAQPEPAGGDLAWLRAQPPDHYTLQIFSGLQRENAQQAADQARSLGRVAIFPFSHEGAEWYGVVLGEYATSAEAKQAADQVAATLGGKAPWARSFASIGKLLPPH